MNLSSVIWHRMVTFLSQKQPSSLGNLLILSPLCPSPYELSQWATSVPNRAQLWHQTKCRLNGTQRLPQKEGREKWIFDNFCLPSLLAGFPKILLIIYCQDQRFGKTSLFENLSFSPISLNMPPLNKFQYHQNNDDDPWGNR